MCTTSFQIFIDINECLDENVKCNQTCVNKQGSYECQCLEGFYLKDNMCFGNDKILLF